MNRPPDTRVSPPVGLDLQIETPENVVLTYELAGPACRMGAYLFDLAVRVAAVIAVSMFVGAAGLALPGVSIGVFLLFLFAIEWGYFVVCEGFFNGKTLGKHLFGLRVIHERGYALTFWAAMLRNLLRAADALPLYGAAFITMVCSRRFQRLGDLAAGTVVVTERRVVLPREPIILERIQPLPREQLGNYVPDQRTLSLIDQFLGRRHVLTHRRAHELASILARPLAARASYSGDRRLVEQYPLAFLARLYVTHLKSLDEGATLDSTAAGAHAALPGMSR